MKGKQLLVIGLIICSIRAFGQTAITDADKIETFKMIHKEAVFIHQNASLLFVGEKLYYKMYCLDTETHALSPISKMGYVELVAPNKTRVFRHKIKLTSGRGHGDFFIPTDLPTGNYKLLGYTQWMKNNAKNYHFIGDINIINLYRTDKNSIAEIDTIKTDTTRIGNTEITQVLSTVKNTGPENLGLSVNKERFGQREKVSMVISTSDAKFYGNFSVSVRRKDEILHSSTLKTTASFLVKTVDDTPSTTDTIYLPELRGELLFGKIKPVKPGSLVAGVKIALSIPGKDFIFKVANTNTKGEFYFNLNEHYDSENAFIQILGNDRNKHIAVLQEISVDYSDLIFDKLALTREMKNLILSRSIHNQIQNAYLEAKQDTLVPVTSDSPFYRIFSKVYDLDDFTRFPTIQETLVEVIENVWLRKDKNGDSFFQVRGSEYFTSSDFLPLVFVDGVLLQNHTDVLEMDARSIKRIGILRDKYEFGLATFQGILAFETFEGNSQSLFNKDFIQEIELTAPIPKKKYFAENYDLGPEVYTDRIPDYRYQLLWLPELLLDANNMTIEFFTSDVVGTYEISLEGFTREGIPISKLKTFDVE